ncbi:hypothetical protein [Streptomyces sp. NRRL S-646]|uniref:hypothetical protein n=1 Tax=Streptomyces sp. NRRL S-646 TaxID=1463917 RepID=UPI0004CA0A12|nr:hypothetical protein [Streptomyces sp. NRRL S-646]
MKRVISSTLSVTLLSGALMMGAGTASAATQTQHITKTSNPVVKVDPVEDVRSLCTVYHDKYACAALLHRNKMTNVVKNFLVKAGIGGAAAFVVGRYISKDAAKDIAAKVVVAGSAACLASFT